MSEIVKRVNDYLLGGGLFNPELANHQNVSVLMRDCRAEIQRLSAEVERLTDTLHHISLCSQNSMSSQAECGRIARAALRPKDN
jgi:hypothetical protein